VPMRNTAAFEAGLAVGAENGSFECEVFLTRRTEGALHKEAVLACEAGVSIKPGARAPGNEIHIKVGACEAGESAINRCSVTRLHGLVPCNESTLGLAPQALCPRLLRRRKRTFCGKPSGGAEVKSYW
jgi:hypothetical protein